MSRFAWTILRGRPGISCTDVKRSRATWVGGACLAILGTLVIAVPTDSLSLRTRAALDAAAMLGARSPGYRAPGAVSDKRPLSRPARAAAAAPPPPIAAVLPDAIPIALPMAEPLAFAVADFPEAAPVRDLALWDRRLPPMLVQDRVASRTPAVSAVPEPSTWSAMLAGFGVSGLLWRRRRVPLAPGVDTLA